MNIVNLDNEILIIRTDTTNSPIETEISVTEVTQMTEMVTNNPGDVVVTAQDSSDQVKPENRDKVIRGAKYRRLNIFILV